MATWETVRLELEGVGLHVTCAGEVNAPAVVLAHGVADDGLCWTTLAQALQRRWRALLVDARGHGRSDAPDGRYDISAHVDDLAGAIAALGLDRPVVIGHSMGGLTALALAGTRPDLLAAIVVEDPPPGAWTHDPAAAEVAHEQHRREELRKELRMLTRRTHDELVAGQRQVAPAWPEAELRRWAEAKQRLDQRALRLFDARLEASVNWPATLHAIRAPALLITGDPAHGALVTPADADELGRAIPHLRHVHVPRAGHSIRHDRPEAYLEAVTAFLDEVAR